MPWLAFFVPVRAWACSCAVLPCMAAYGNNSNTASVDVGILVWQDALGVQLSRGLQESVAPSRPPSAQLQSLPGGGSADGSSADGGSDAGGGTSAGSTSGPPGDGSGEGGAS